MKVYCYLFILFSGFACAQELPSQSEQLEEVVLVQRKRSLTPPEVYNSDSNFPVIEVDRKLYGLDGKQLNPVDGFNMATLAYPTFEEVYFWQKDKLYRIDGNGEVRFFQNQKIGDYFDLDRHLIPGDNLSGFYGKVGVISGKDTLLPYYKYEVSFSRDQRGDLAYIYGCKPARPGERDTTVVLNANGTLLNTFVGRLQKALPGGQWIYQANVRAEADRAAYTAKCVITKSGEVVVAPRWDTKEVLPFNDTGFALLRHGEGSFAYIYGRQNQYLDSLALVTVRKAFYVERSGERFRASLYDGSKSLTFDASPSFGRRRYKISPPPHAVTERHLIVEKGDSTYILNEDLEVVKKIAGTQLELQIVDKNWIVLDDHFTLFNPNSGEEKIFPLISDYQTVISIGYERGQPVQVLFKTGDIYRGEAPGIVVIDFNTLQRSRTYKGLRHLVGRVYYKPAAKQVVSLR